VSKVITNPMYRLVRDYGRFFLRQPRDLINSLVYPSHKAHFPLFTLLPRETVRKISGTS
jgi:hypothetical protein